MKESIMNKLNSFLYKYKHAWILSYFFVYLIWFVLLENRSYVKHTSIYITLDDWVPFCEYFIIPFMLWFAYIAITVLYFFFTNVSDYYKYCSFLFIGMTICLIIYTIFPNEQNLRPTVFANDNIFTQLVQGIYKTDTSTNVCPSIHCFNSLVAFIAIIKNDKLKKKRSICIGSGVLTVLICLSTVFLKQHSVFDGFCALALTFILYPFIYKINYSDLFANISKKEKTLQENNS